MASFPPPPQSVLSPQYEFYYVTPGGACLIFEAVTEGFEDESGDDPPNERAVDVPGVPTAGPVRLGWGTPSETAGGWAGGRVTTEWFGVDDPVFRLTTGDGCPPPSVDDAEALLASLRPLDPADDATLIGPVYTAERMDDWPPPNRDLEEAARGAFSSTTAGGREATTFETLRRRDRHAVVLVTTRGGGLAYGMRTRGVLVLVRGQWHIESYGSQWQCLPGDTEWVATPCT